MTLSPFNARLLAATGLMLATFGSVAALRGVAGAASPAVALATLGAGLGLWLLFPRFGRRAGWAGMAIDLCLFLLALILGGALAGTLVQPGAFTVIGMVSALLLPASSALAAVFHGLALALVLNLSRRRA